MALQFQHNAGELFNRSNFLAREIPPVVFAATRYTRLRDVGVNDKRLVCQAGELLSLLATEFKNTTRDLPDFLLDICLARRAVEEGILGKYANEAPPLIYDAIKERCKSASLPFFYGDYQVTNPDKTAQRALFRSDVATHLERSHTNIKDLSVLDANTLLSIDCVAMFLLEFSKKSLNREQEKIKPAEIYAKLIAAAQTKPSLMVGFCLQHFTSLLDAKLKPKAAQILARQLATSHPALSALVDKIASGPSTLSDGLLSQEDRHQLMSDLQREVRGHELTLRFLLRPYVIEDVTAIKEVNRAIPAETPEWIKTLFTNGRVDGLDIDSFSLASKRMNEQLGSATTVSIDLGLFMWPRITEIAALARPLDLLIHSDLPFSSRAPEDVGAISQATISALAGKLPNFLPFMAIMNSAHEVLAREKAWLQPAEARDLNSLDFFYKADEGVRKARLSLHEGCSTQRRVSKLLGREIQAPCFIIEGSSPEAPRAFGVLWQKLMPDTLANFTFENFRNISLFFNKDEAVRTGRDLKNLILPKVEIKKVHQPPPPPSAASLVSVSDELRTQAATALRNANRYGGTVEANSKAAPVVALLKEIAEGRCPKGRDLRVVKSIEHDIKHSAVTGGVRALFEDALPVLCELAEAVGRNRES